jgi:hypothetical protein
MKAAVDKEDVELVSFLLKHSIRNPECTTVACSAMIDWCLDNGK